MRQDSLEISWAGQSGDECLRRCELQVAPNRVRHLALLITEAHTTERVAPVTGTHDVCNSVVQRVQEKRHADFSVPGQCESRVESTPQACFEGSENPCVQWLQKPCAFRGDQEHLETQTGSSPKYVHVQMGIGHIPGELQQRIRTMRATHTGHHLQNANELFVIQPRRSSS